MLDSVANLHVKWAFECLPTISLSKSVLFMLIISILIIQNGLNSRSDFIYVVYFCCESLNPDLITWDKHKCLQWLAFNGHSEYRHRKFISGYIYSIIWIWKKKSAINYLCKLLEYASELTVIVIPWKKKKKKKESVVLCSAVLCYFCIVDTAQLSMNIFPQHETPHMKENLGPHWH